MYSFEPLLLHGVQMIVALIMYGRSAPFVHVYTYWHAVFYPASDSCLNFFLNFYCKKLSRPTKLNMPKIMVSIFLTMKATHDL